MGEHVRHEAQECGRGSGDKEGGATRGMTQREDSNGGSHIRTVWHHARRTLFLADVLVVVAAMLDPLLPLLDD